MDALTKLSVEEIVSDPEWLPHRITPDLSQLTFARVPRELQPKITFLEEKSYPADLAYVSATMEAVHKATADFELTARFIFHSSMATSTLLARVFDLPATSMSLAEPIILNQLAALHRRGVGMQAPLQTVLKLLGRPFGEREAVVVKAGNTANVLIPQIIACQPRVRAIFIHAPIRQFLKSIAKKGLRGRVIYRRLYALLSRDRHLPTGFTSEDIFEQTDLQIAAMAWLIHQAEFAEFARRWPDNFRTLDSEQFLARKAESLAAMAAHFVLELDSDAIAASAVFKRHSKEVGRRFDDQDRAKEYARTELAYGEELEMVATWLESVAGHVGVPLTLPSPLLAS
jgi:hypothetical protein